MKGKKAQKAKASAAKSTTTVKKVSSKAKTDEKLANGFESDEKKEAKNASEVKTVENKTDTSDEEMVSAEAENVDSSPETQDEEMEEDAGAKTEESAEAEKESTKSDEAGTSKKTAPRSRKKKGIAEAHDEETSAEKEPAEAKETSPENDEAGTSKKATSRSRKKKADVAETQDEEMKEETKEEKEEPAEAKEASPENDEAGTSKKAASRSRKKKADVAETQEEEMKEEAREEEVKDAETKDSEAGPSKKTATRSRRKKAAVVETEDEEMKEETSPQNQESAEVKVALSENVEAGPSQKPASRSRKRKADVVDQQKITSKTKAKKLKAALEIPKLNSVGGKVFVIGDNSCGQLGLGEEISEKKRPSLLDLPHSIVDIAAGGMHSVCLTESGEIITFGCNDEGALGRPTTEEGSENIPRKVNMPERIVQVSAGDSHSAALAESGQVYIWGNFRNKNGQMGLVSENTKQNAPVKILDNIKVVKIASGTDHLSCLSEDGDVYTCGNGESGQLGRVSEHSSLDGGRRGISVLLRPEKVSVQTKPCVIDNIWTGSFATFLSEQKNGSIYAFGLNNYGQLGVTDQNTIWKPMLIPSFRNHTWSHINGDQHHTLALENSGQVFSLGRSEYGRLGLGNDASETSVPTLIPTLEDNKCIDASCGNCVSFAVTDNGSVYSFGMGTNCQLGHGNEEDQHVPKLIEGNFHSSWKAFKVSGGGQHTLILAHPKQAQKNVDEK